jgi:excisionase family DNA binding protein
MKRRAALPPPPPEPDRLLLEPLSYSPEDAALVTGLARTAIYALIRDGKLKSIKEGKRRIIPRTEIQAYLDSNAA